MKKMIIIGIAVLAAGAGIYAGCRQKPVRYREVKSERMAAVVEFRVTGSVSPRNRLEIKPPVQGRIEDILVREGQRVKKGETIAWLSSSERAALLDAARARGAAELARWEDVYRPTPVIAPLDGFIIVRTREPGQSVALSDAVLVMADQLIIDANVDETDLRHITLGQKVKIYLDAYADQPFDGVVEHIAYESAVINNVTVYNIKIRPLSPQGRFRAGMTATVEVRTKPRENTLFVPLEAVTTAGGVSSVMVRGSRGRAVKRVVKTGVSMGKNIEIVSGIADEDAVLVVVAGRKAAGKKSATNARRGGIPGMGGGH